MVFSISRGVAYSLLFAIVGVCLSGSAIAEDVELKSLSEEVIVLATTIDQPTSTNIASSTSDTVPTVPTTPSGVPTEPSSSTVSSSAITEPSTTVTVPSGTVSSEATSVTTVSTEIPSSTPPITLATESSTDTSGTVTVNTSPKTSTPVGQNPTTSDPSLLPNPPSAKAPTWAIVLLSILLCFAAIFTGLYFLRKHLLRKRQMDRRRLLSTRGSQEGFFMGSDTAFENGRL